MSLEQLFIKLGYTKDDYILIRNSYSLKKLREETLIRQVKRNYNWLLEFGYSKEEVIKITKTLPTIYGLSIENMIQKIEEVVGLGYIKQEIIKMTKSFPQLYSITIESIKQKIEDLIEIGYSKEEVIKMTRNFPQLYSITIEFIKQKIEDLMELGYSKEEVIKITKDFSSIYSFSIDSMKQKIEDLMELGYSKEEVIKMTKSLPTIFGLSIENMKQKISFYDSINMHELAVVDSKMLMQSVNLSYARYNFYLKIGIPISMDNYKKLFISNKIFENQFKITKTELLKMYDYEKYIEEKKNGRII